MSNGIYPIAVDGKFAGVYDYKQQQCRTATPLEEAAYDLTAPKIKTTTISFSLTAVATPAKRKQEASMWRKISQTSLMIVDKLWNGSTSTARATGCGGSSEPAPLGDAGINLPSGDAGNIPVTPIKPSNLEGGRFGNSNVNDFVVDLNIPAVYFKDVVAKGGSVYIELYSNPQLIDPKLIDPKNPGSVKIPCKAGALRLTSKTNNTQTDAHVWPAGDSGTAVKDGGSSADLKSSDAGVGEAQNSYDAFKPISSDAFIPASPDAGVAADAFVPIKPDSTPHTDPFDNINWLPVLIQSMTLSHNGNVNKNLYPDQTEKTNNFLSALCKPSDQQPTIRFKVDPKFYTQYLDKAQSQAKTLSARLRVPVSLDKNMWYPNSEYILALQGRIITETHP